MSAVTEALEQMNDYDQAIRKYISVSIIDAKSQDSSDAWKEVCDRKDQIVQVLAAGIYEISR